MSFTVLRPGWCGVVFSLEDHPVVLACIANLALHVSSSPCSWSNTVTAWDVLSADLFSRLPQTFSPNTPNGLADCFVILALRMRVSFTRLVFRFPVAAGVVQACLLPYTFIAFGDSTSSPHCANFQEMGQKRSKETIKRKRHYMMKHRGKAFIAWGSSLLEVDDQSHHPCWQVLP